MSPNGCSKYTEADTINPTNKGLSLQQASWE